MQQLINLKNTWMASHITDAEFPTPLSETGLALYQQNQPLLNANPVTEPLESPDGSLSIYPVDCHPLTIRYSLVLASKWEQSDDEKEALVEYLTQIMFEPDSPAQLFVGFFKGKPAACGMIYHDAEHGTLVADVHALPLPNQAALIKEMKLALLKQSEASLPTLFIEE
ncbi:hypothetical protein L4C36_14645 [Photobacterium japonica]|uniref:hypothetical protein n=1 Tax=Photobacterium japonica TaxID=2910235 RepID=UPI003D0D65E1